MIQKIRQLFFWQNYHFKGKIFSTSGIFSISISTACIKKTTKSFSMIMNHEESQIQLLMLAYQIISSLCFIKISFWWFMILKHGVTIFDLTVIIIWPWQSTMTIKRGLVICYYNHNEEIWNKILEVSWFYYRSQRGILYLVLYHF